VAFLRRSNDETSRTRQVRLSSCASVVREVETCSSEHVRRNIRASFRMMLAAQKSTLRDAVVAIDIGRRFVRSGEAPSKRPQALVPNGREVARHVIGIHAIASALWRPFARCCGNSWWRGFMLSLRFRPSCGHERGDGACSLGRSRLFWGEPAQRGEPKPEGGMPS
jgi:hypothetical protein